MRAGRPQLPNLFIIGAPKCGTTALHSALSRVPGFSMSVVKEPAFFSNDELFSLGLEYYLQGYFAPSDGAAFRGEATPWYLYCPDAMRRMKDLVPDVQAIIVLVRNPVARAVSMYADQVGAGMESRGLETAFNQEMQLLESGRSWPRMEQRYLEHGLYTQFIRPWQQSFGRERVLVLPSPGEVSNQEFWSLLSTRLGRDLGRCELDFNTAADANMAGRSRFNQGYRAVSWAGRNLPGIKRGVRRALPPGFDQKLIQSLRRKSTVRDGHRPVVSKAVENDLKIWYEPECQRLKDQFGIEILLPEFE